MHDAIELTPLEKYVDEIIRFENRDRYIDQSKRTKHAHRADITPRPKIVPYTRQVKHDAD